MAEARIRRARPEEVETIAALSVEAFAGETINWFLQQRFGPGCPPLRGKTWDQLHAETIREHLREDPEKVLVAELEGQVVGYMTYRIDREASTGIVSYNAVHPNYQRRGIATALISRVLDTFRREGLRYARVRTLETDTRARGLYEKVGFEELVKFVDYIQVL